MPLSCPFDTPVASIREISIWNTCERCSVIILVLRDVIGVSLIEIFPFCSLTEFDFFASSNTAPMKIENIGSACFEANLAVSSIMFSTQLARLRLGLFASGFTESVLSKSYPVVPIDGWLVASIRISKSLTAACVPSSYCCSGLSTESLI